MFVRIQLPHREVRGMSLKQPLKYGLIALVVWWVIQEPTSAGHFVHGIGNLLSEIAHGLATFVANI